MMKFVFDHYALLYMLEQFPQSIVPDLWELFAGNCDNECIISHREAMKQLDQDAIEISTLEWIKKHSSCFKPTTAKEAELLGVMMNAHDFDFLSKPSTMQRRIPESIPFLLCMSKEQDRIYVYRKNTNIDFIEKTKKVCASYEIKYMEVEECLKALKANS